MKHILLYTTRQSTLNCREKRLTFSMFIDLAMENNLNFFREKKFRKLGMLKLRSIICGIFHTSIRYQMFLYILVENFTAHLLVKSLGQTIETI